MLRFNLGFPLIPTKKGIHHLQSFLLWGAASGEAGAFEGVTAGGGMVVSSLEFVWVL